MGNLLLAARVFSWRMCLSKSPRVSHGKRSLKNGWGASPREAIAEAVRLAPQALLEHTAEYVCRTNSRVNILDENIIDSQRQRLRHWRIAVRHMGYDVGRQGMKDQEILTVLHRLRRPNLF